MKMKTNTKGIDVFCSSPASTAICNATVTKPLQRLNSYIGQHYKALTDNIPKSNYAPCISELPLTPLKLNYCSDLNYQNLTPRRKSSADVSDLPHLRKKHTHLKSNYSPPSNSSRYLLGDSPFLDSLSLERSECTNFSAQNREWRKSRSHNKEGDNINPKLVKINDFRPLNSSSSTCAPALQQVVALRVSLHCKACEAKLRKHLSKMEGVTSFSIDMETKKVVVTGKVTPFDVLTRISKVKNAQFWSSQGFGSTSSSSSSSSKLEKHKFTTF